MKRFLLMMIVLLSSTFLYAKITWMPEEEYAVYDIKDGEQISSKCIAYANCDTLAEAMRITGVDDMRKYLVSTIADISVKDNINYRVIYYVTPDDKRGYIIIYERLYDAVYKVYFIKRGRK